MKPKNNTEVRKAYLRFAGYLTCCTILAVSIFACFLKTSGIEVKRITEQALEYDHIYAKELSLSNSMDSIYQYMKLMNTSPQINDKLLLENLNIFLGVKDSIRLPNIQEEMVKKDLMQCIQDNWKTRRNLNVGSGGNKQ